MQERIFAPLGMSDTGYVVASGNNARLVTLHIPVEGGFVEQPNPEGAVSVGVRGDVQDAGGRGEFANPVPGARRAPVGVNPLALDRNGEGEDAVQSRRELRGGEDWQGCEERADGRQSVREPANATGQRATIGPTGRPPSR